MLLVIAGDISSEVLAAAWAEVSRGAKIDTRRELERALRKLVRLHPDWKGRIYYNVS